MKCPKFQIEAPRQPMGNPLLCRIALSLAVISLMASTGFAGDTGAGQAAASDTASTSESTPATPDEKKKNVGIVLYPGFEVLDVYGPVEMWGYVPDFNLVMVAEKAGPVMSYQGVATIADYSFDDAPELDIIMVPGGFGTLTELNNEPLLQFLRDQHEQTELTTSVCTGSALLAAAGILEGHRATTNKRFFSLAVEQDPDVDWVVEARWVDDGKVITSSGVTAGMDMALHLIARLYGKEHAYHLASGIEYEWHDDPDDDPFAKFVESRFTEQD